MITIKDAVFLKSAPSARDLEDFGLPEIAFIGRSNVGKSSLINALTNRRDLARTSSTPGRTRAVNYFRINDRVILADLPGYGYAKIAKDERRHWDTLIRSYLKGPHIMEFAFLIDCRRTIDGEDEAILQLLARQAPTWLVMTKTDKASRNELQKFQAGFERYVANLRLPIKVAAVSTFKKQGVKELQEQIFSRYFELDIAP